MVLMVAEKKGFWENHLTFKKFCQVGILTGIAWVGAKSVEYFPGDEEIILFSAVLMAAFNYLKHNWING